MEEKNESTIEELQAKLDACEKEKGEYLDGWKRAKADFVNYKKDEAERVATLAKFANESLLQELVLILDSFALGLSVLEGDKAAEKGMNLVKLQLEDVLRKYGLERIKISPGDAFDPATQEAVGEVPSASPPGSVAEIAEDGYALNGKVVRPAKVRVAKGQNDEQ